MATEKSLYLKKKMMKTIDPMDNEMVNKASPKGIFGVKKYWDNVAKQRNAIADKKMMLNRLPNAATNYRDFPNNRVR